MKLKTLALGGLLVAAFAWPWAEDAYSAVSDWTWTRNLSTQSYAFKKVGADSSKFNYAEADSIVVENKIRVDSLFVEEYSEGVGIPRQSMPPGTCNDDQQVRLYEDSDDDGLYRCVNTTWTRVADDGDQDGFSTAIDPDDSDDSDPAGYFQLVTYSNPTLYWNSTSSEWEINSGNSAERVVDMGGGTGGTPAGQRDAAFLAGGVCIHAAELDGLSSVSFTRNSGGTVNTYERQASVSQLLYYFSPQSDGTASTRFNAVTGNDPINGITCYDTTST